VSRLAVVVVFALERACWETLSCFIFKMERNFKFSCHIVLIYLKYLSYFLLYCSVINFITIVARGKWLAYWTGNPETRSLNPVYGLRVFRLIFYVYCSAQNERVIIHRKIPFSYSLSVIVLLIFWFHRWIDIGLYSFWFRRLMIKH
jgi:hypothetical protein